MEAMMASKTQLSSWALALGVLGVPLTAQDAAAGYRSPYDAVWVDTATMWASGGLGTAYNTPDDVQYIGCNVTQYNDNTLSVSCFAQDLENHYTSCWSDNPAFANTVYGMTADSRLDFLSSPDGTCRFVSVQNASFNVPKLP
jgi:hypothetical protein